MFPKKVYRSPCLMKFVNEMENLLINYISGVLCFLKEIEKNEVLSKIYCVKIRNQDDLRILCENHLIVSILASAKYNCSAGEGEVLTEKMNKRFTELKAYKFSYTLLCKNCRKIFKIFILKKLHGIIR